MLAVYLVEPRIRQRPPSTGASNCNKSSPCARGANAQTLTEPSCATLTTPEAS